jgi:hypothetical protein
MSKRLCACVCSAPQCVLECCAAVNVDDNRPACVRVLELSSLQLLKFILTQVVSSPLLTSTSTSAHSSAVRSLGVDAFEVLYHVLKASYADMQSNPPLVRLAIPSSLFCFVTTRGVGACCCQLQCGVYVCACVCRVSCCARLCMWSCVVMCPGVSWHARRC